MDAGKKRRRRRRRRRRTGEEARNGVFQARVVCFLHVSLFLSRFLSLRTSAKGVKPKIPSLVSRPMLLATCEMKRKKGGKERRGGGEGEKSEFFFLEEEVFLPLGQATSFAAKPFQLLERETEQCSAR